MSIIKIAPGGKLANSNITGNTQIGGNTLVNNQGEIESTKIERNLHISTNTEYPGGVTWVDKEYDPYFMELPPDERFRRLKAIGRWLKDHVLAAVISAVIVSILTTILVFYITRWLSQSQITPPPAIAEPKAMPV